jgi:hypothetical protein
MTESPESPMELVGLISDRGPGGQASTSLGVQSSHARSSIVVELKIDVDVPEGRGHPDCLGQNINVDSVGL